MIQRLKRICWLLHLNRFMEKYFKCFKNNNNLFFLRCEEKSFKRKIEKNFFFVWKFWINNGWGDMVATLDFPWLSFLKRTFFKKLFDSFFFHSYIQKFYHWSNNTNKNMMIWAFLKRAVVCKANIQWFLLTTFESQGLFNNYFCYCRSPKFCHF